jgi:hypothetical protein
MNKTQRITNDWLHQSGLQGDELLLEALLRRGFLAFREDQSVWLGTGSHINDLRVLQFIDGLKVVPVSGHPDRMALVTFEPECIKPEDIASSIIQITENHCSENNFFRRGISYQMGEMTTGGLTTYMTEGWNSYRAMSWGAKMAVCPMREKEQFNDTYRYRTANNALDLGVALLVKVFPLARVATRYSCDGHGERHAYISYCYAWDACWAKCVFDALGFKPASSNWIWKLGHDGTLSIEPAGGFDDAAVKAMLDDIQLFARQLLNQSTINNIGFARTRTLETFSSNKPTPERFADEAKRQLVFL